MGLRAQRVPRVESPPSRLRAQRARVTIPPRPTYTPGVWLKEIVFQGLFGVERPARLPVDAGFTTLALPPGADPHDIQTLLLSLLYPRLVPSELIDELSDGDGRRARIGAVFAVPGVAGRVHKVYRRSDPESVVVQEVPDGGRGQEIARGVDAATAVLAQVHGVPPNPDDFLLLHCAEFEDYLPSVSTGDPATDDLITRYREALEIERLEGEISEVTGRLGDLERDIKKLGKRDKRMAEVDGRLLEIARILDDGGADLETVRGFDAASKDLEGRVHDFQNQIAQARSQQDAIRPRPLWREYLLVGGVAVAVLATIASFLPELRPVALVNLGAFTVAGWALIRRFGVMEQSSGYMTRVEQVYRHVESAQEERGALEREFRAALLRLGLESADEVDHLGDERKELQARLGAMTGRLDAETTRAKLAEYSAEEHALRATLDGLQTQRAAHGRYTVAPFEMERQLEALGVAVAGLRLSEASSTAGALFAALAQLARTRRQLRDGHLTEKTAAMVGRFGKHLLGAGFAQIDLSDTGTLSFEGLDSESVQRWLERGGSDVRLVAMALAGSLIATSPAALVGASRLLLLSRPYSGLDDGQAKRVAKLFDYLGKYMQVLVLEAKV